MVDVRYDESIYFDMYTWGLKHIPLCEIESACSSVGKAIRRKDYENYWRGWQNSDIASDTRDIFATRKPIGVPYDDFVLRKWEDYPVHPYAGMPDLVDKWVPCSKDNKPLVPWSDQRMSKIDASCYPGSVYLGENMRGCQTIVIDCDGDHELPLDMRTISFLRKYTGYTHTLDKPKRIEEYEGYEDSGLTIPASFHLTFKVDRIVPTMHWKWCHIDVVGNEKNSLRYLKNKVWNGLEPAPMTPEIWEEIKAYVKRRKINYDNVTV